MKQRLRSLKIRPLLFTLLAAGLTLVAACDDDDPGTPTDTSMMDGDAAGDTGVDTGGEDTSGTDTATGDTGQDMADTSGDTTADTTGDTAGDTGVDTSDTMAGDMDADTTGDTTRFTVTIENISNAEGILPSPISPGAWAVHDDSVTFFTADDTASAGFELLAEDGDPSTLSTELDGLSLTGKGVFNTPDGGSMGPAFPGDVYSFEFDVPNTMTGARLSLATMFVQSNDWLLTAPPAGIELFDGTGAAISGDVTDQLGLWDAGTERDQAPGFGLTQAPRQPEGNYGPAEGVVAEWDDTTRATPVAAGILDFSVTESGGTYDITVTNVSTSNALFTPVSPIFWATHDSSASLFTPGSTASAGIEAIAEDGDTSTMDTAADSMSGVDQNGTVATRDSDSSTGPILPNDSYTLSITPTSAGGMLSIATMLVQSNDVLIATKRGQRAPRRRPEPGAAPGWGRYRYRGGRHGRALSRYDQRPRQQHLAARWARVDHCRARYRAQLVRRHRHSRRRRSRHCRHTRRLGTPRRVGESLHGGHAGVRRPRESGRGWPGRHARR